MSRHSDIDQESLRDRVIGLGESSVRKTYYPELQKRLAELERFRALLDQTHDMILLVSCPDCTVVDANATACAELGYGRERLLGLRLAELMAGTSAVEEFLGGAESGTASTSLTPCMRRAGGETFPAEVTLTRMTFDDRSYGVAVCRDITERLNAEEAERREEVLKRLNAELEERVNQRTIELARTNELLQSAGEHTHRLSYQTRLQMERLREQQMRLRKLLELPPRMMRESGVEGVLQAVVDAAREIVGARYGVAGHVFAADGFRIDGMSRHEEAAPCPPGTTFTVERGGVYLQMLQEGRPLRLDDAALRAHPAWWGLPAGHAELRGLLAAPVLGPQGEPRGFVMLSDKIDGGDFDEDDEALLTHIIGIASLAFRHERCG
ncbi:MAG TPA: PAS domain S-box protein [Verrucomicrobiae bacterium]|nr:PAS domain S-box protein [Verrucomicrobiae bacterium]